MICCLTLEESLSLMYSEIPLIRKRSQKRIIIKIFASFASQMIVYWIYHSLIGIFRAVFFSAQHLTQICIYIESVHEKCLQKYFQQTMEVGLASLIVSAAHPDHSAGILHTFLPHTMIHMTSLNLKVLYWVVGKCRKRLLITQKWDHNTQKIFLTKWFAF